jgi:hypothetical protein
LKTVNRNLKNSGDKEDYSVNIYFATWSYRPLTFPTVMLLFALSSWCLWVSCIFQVFLFIICQGLNCLFPFILHSQHCSQCYSPWMTTENKLLHIFRYEMEEKNSNREFLDSQMSISISRILLHGIIFPLFYNGVFPYPSLNIKFCENCDHK